MKFSTKQIHAGREKNVSPYGDVNIPIHQSTSFVHDSVDQYLEKGFSYSRTSNPTIELLEDRLNQLEDGSGALCFSTGMAAIHSVFDGILKTGDHVIISDVVYGGTYRISKAIFAKYDIEFSFIDTSKPEEIKKAIRPNTKIIFTETPANPTLKICDLKLISEISKNHQILHVVDNTFMTPYLQNPLSLGADIVIHSTTKFFDGHNMTTGGCAVFSDKETFERIKFIRNTSGNIMSPFTAFLTLQGLKTLSLRLERQCLNAHLIAEYLNKHKVIERVFYPGLEDFPGHQISCNQSSDHGSLLAFIVKGDLNAGKKFADNLKLCLLAENLGSVETLVTHPASMTHGYLTHDERQSIGITDSLIRMSVGIEDPEDLLNDIEQSLATLHG